MKLSGGTDRSGVRPPQVPSGGMRKTGLASLAVVLLLGVGKLLGQGSIVVSNISADLTGVVGGEVMKGGQTGLGSWGELVEEIGMMNNIDLMNRINTLLEGTDYSITIGGGGDIMGTTELTIHIPDGEDMKTTFGEVMSEAFKFDSVMVDGEIEPKVAEQLAISAILEIDPALGAIAYSGNASIDSLMNVSSTADMAKYINIILGDMYPGWSVKIKGDPTPTAWTLYNAGNTVGEEIPIIIAPDAKGIGIKLLLLVVKEILSK